MIYLIAAIASSFTVSILIKFFESKKTDTLVYLAANYISACLTGWIFAFSAGINSISKTTLLLGFIGGMIWPGSFFMLMWGIRQFGLSLTGTISRLCLVIPVMFALIFLGEQFSRNTILGIITAFTAFFMLNPLNRSDPGKLNKKAVWFFPLLLIVFGIGDLWVNVFNTYGNKNENFIFILLIFTFSSAFVWSFILIKKIKTGSPVVTRPGMLRGFLLGIPNYFSTYFLLECLKTGYFSGHSASVYALYSTFGISLAFLAGRFIWREKVTRLNIAGALTAVLAIILLNFR